MYVFSLYCFGLGHRMGALKEFCFDFRSVLIELVRFRVIWVSNSCLKLFSHFSSYFLSIFSLNFLLSSLPPYSIPCFSLFFFFSQSITIATRLSTSKIFQNPPRNVTQNLIHSKISSEIPLLSPFLHRNHISKSTTTPSQNHMIN